MDNSNRVLRIGLPSGSLQEPTFALFAKAGFNITGASRSYKPQVDDPELVIRLLRAQEISRYVEHGFLDCGLTGKDWVENNGSDVARLCEMTFSKASAQPTRWVIAVPEDSPIRSVKDLQGKIIATEAVDMTRRYLAQHGVTAEVEFSWGATEVKVPDLVDAIVDVTETGSSLRANKLRILETIMQSSPQFIANKKALEDPWKKGKIDKLILLLQGAFAARDKVGLKMNLPEERLQDLLKALPALRNPTVSQLTLAGWVAVETIIDEKIVREIIPELKALGAEGIIEYPLNKVVY
ncbi:ATP phosphoribosyltransferase [Verrucomicrobiota bacterium sgz303538]